MNRVKRTLAGFTEVTEVDFIPHRELFSVEYTSDLPKGADFREAVLDVVIAPGVRKILGEVGSCKNEKVSPENNVVH